MGEADALGFEYCPIGSRERRKRSATPTDQEAQRRESRRQDNRIRDPTDRDFSTGQTKASASTQHDNDDGTHGDHETGVDERYEESASPWLKNRHTSCAATVSVIGSAGSAFLRGTRSTCGRICFKSREVNLSQVFAGQQVGIREMDEHIWLVTLMDYDLGYFDDETCRLEPIENPFGPMKLVGMTGFEPATP